MEEATPGAAAPSGGAYPASQPQLPASAGGAPLSRRARRRPVVACVSLSTTIDAYAWAALLTRALARHGGWKDGGVPAPCPLPRFVPQGEHCADGQPLVRLLVTDVECEREYRRSGAREAARAEAAAAEAAGCGVVALHAPPEAPAATSATRKGARAAHRCLQADIGAARAAWLDADARDATLFADALAVLRDELAAAIERRAGRLAAEAAEAARLAETLATECLPLQAETLTETEPSGLGPAGGSGESERRLAARVGALRQRVATEEALAELMEVCRRDAAALAHWDECDVALCELARTCEREYEGEGNSVDRRQLERPAPSLRGYEFLSAGSTAAADVGVSRALAEGAAPRDMRQVLLARRAALLLAASALAPDSALHGQHVARLGEATLALLRDYAAPAAAACGAGDGDANGRACAEALADVESDAEWATAPLPWALELSLCVEALVGSAMGETDNSADDSDLIEPHASVRLRAELLVVARHALHVLGDALKYARPLPGEARVGSPFGLAAPPLNASAWAFGLAMQEGSERCAFGVAALRSEAAYEAASRALAMQLAVCWQRCGRTRAAAALHAELATRCCGVGLFGEVREGLATATVPTEVLRTAADAAARSGWAAVAAPALDALRRRQAAESEHLHCVGSCLRLLGLSALHPNAVAVGTRQEAHQALLEAAIRTAEAQGTGGEGSPGEARAHLCSECVWVADTQVAQPAQPVAGGFGLRDCCARPGDGLALDVRIGSAFPLELALQGATLRLVPPGNARDGRDGHLAEVLVLRLVTCEARLAPAEEPAGTLRFEGDLSRDASPGAYSLGELLLCVCVAGEPPSASIPLVLRTSADCARAPLLRVAQTAQRLRLGAHVGDFQDDCAGVVEASAEATAAGIPSPGMLPRHGGAWADVCVSCAFAADVLDFPCEMHVRGYGGVAVQDPQPVALKPMCEAGLWSEEVAAVLVDGMVRLSESVCVQGLMGVALRLRVRFLEGGRGSDDNPNAGERESDESGLAVSLRYGGRADGARRDEKSQAPRGGWRREWLSVLPLRVGDAAIASARPRIAGEKLIVECELRPAVGDDSRRPPIVIEAAHCIIDCAAENPSLELAPLLACPVEVCGPTRLAFAGDRVALLERSALHSGGEVVVSIRRGGLRFETCAAFDVADAMHTADPAPRVALVEAPRNARLGSPAAFKWRVAHDASSVSDSETFSYHVACGGGWAPRGRVAAKEVTMSASGAEVRASALPLSEAAHLAPPVLVVDGREFEAGESHAVRVLPPAADDN